MSSPNRASLAKPRIFHNYLDDPDDRRRLREGVRLCISATATGSTPPCSTPPLRMRIEVVLGGIRMPRMNALMERWVQTRRRELLDRTLVWNQRHLRHALREFEQHYNSHRPRQGIADARPLHPLPPPITDPGTIAHRDIRRHDRLGGTLHAYQHAA
ncbi:integrase core domain-containing protein [Streptomyces sp. NPDC058067]|uniref:integrase core domain-containing protein n=1 Tax=Streptomyces sp. NPDC058067 TaxID=3346324 RepID=UPI0036ECFBED